MELRVKAGLLSSLLLLLLSGCGLNMACPSLSDSEISALVTIVESDRNIGISKEEEVGGVIDVCTSASEECVPCLLAIVDDVYSSP